MTMNGAVQAPPVAIAAAPNGGRRTKVDHPALPLTANELARTASSCHDAGAAMLHLHVRDRESRHILDADAYREAIKAVQNAVGENLVIQITTEAVGRYRPEEQMAVVRDVKPEAASLALKELVPDESHLSEFASFLAFLKKEAIVPQIILYSADEARALVDYMARGLVPFDDLPVLYVLGRYSKGQKSTPTDLLPFLAPDISRFNHFMVCAFGPTEAACVTASALLGGHIRVGFENNLFLPDGRIAPDNAALVSAASQPLRAVGLELADAERLRSDWNALMN